MRLKGSNMDLIKVTVVELFGDRKELPAEAVSIKLKAPTQMLLSADNVMAIHSEQHDIIGHGEDALKVVGIEDMVTIISLYRPLYWAAVGKYYLPYIAIAVEEQPSHFSRWF